MALHNNSEFGFSRITSPQQNKLSAIIGHFLGSKKRKWWPELVELAQQRGITLKQIDLDVSLESQGPFDIIIHKTSSLVATEQSDKKSANRLRNLESYFHNHPETIAVDDIEAVRNVTDREKTCLKLRDLNVVSRRGTVRQPHFVISNEKLDNYELFLRNNPINFPVVCKPLVADGTDDAHMMALVFNEKGIREMKSPFMLQEFIDHDALLFKLYVVGDFITLIRRPSLENIDMSKKTIDFEYFGRISNARSEEEDAGSSKQGVESHWDVKDPHPELLQLLAKDISERLSLTAFGVDIIQSPTTKEYFVIDINYFPGYYGINNFGKIFLDFLTKQIQNRRSKLSTTSTSQNSSTTSNSVTVEGH